MRVKATRMGLLQTKKKLKLASKGHSLLKKKRDALIMEFFKTLKEIKQLRLSIGDKLALAQLSLRKAQATQGENDIERFAVGTATGVDFDFETRKIMSVQIPSITNIKTQNEWFGFFESTVELDNAITKYREIFPDLLALSAKQLAFQRLATEIQSTKRKVNSLEYLVMPRLTKEKKIIALKLEEAERENFTRLKKIKAKSE